MLVTIDRIETAGPDRRARRLVFSGFDAEPRLTSASAVKELGLEPGSGVDLASLEADLAEAEAHLARERAVRILEHRERSAHELRTRLIDDGYPRELAEEIVDRYLELGLVDDARFAALWVRTRAGAGFGRQRIQRELATKGIDEETARHALDEILHADDEASRARAVLGSRIPRDRAERERLIARLVRKGFGLSAALSAVDATSSDEAIEDDFQPG